MNNSPLHRLFCLMGLIMGLVSLPGHAQIASPEPAGNADTTAEQRPAPDIASGNAIHNWLKAQDSGAHASKYKQTLSGPAMSRAYSRYIESFGGASSAPPSPEAAASK
jgi:hypothetical protein